MSIPAILRVTAEIPFPADIFEQAKAMAKLEPVLVTFRKALPEGSKFEARPVQARNETGPRKRRAPQPEVPADTEIQEAAE